jgi:hypothetical protein
LGVFLCKEELRIYGAVYSKVWVFIWAAAFKRFIGCCFFESQCDSPFIAKLK